MSAARRTLRSSSTTSFAERGKEIGSLQPVPPRSYTTLVVSSAAWAWIL